LKEFEIESNDYVQEITKNCFKFFSENYINIIDYFPEYLLANKLNCCIYAMCEYENVNDIIKFYDELFKNHNIDGGRDVFLSD
jgi:hypothetical protein